MRAKLFRTPFLALIAYRSRELLPVVKLCSRGGPMPRPPGKKTADTFEHKAAHNQVIDIGM
jgi:hypothetical protein